MGSVAPLILPMTTIFFENEGDQSFSNVVPKYGFSDGMASQILTPNGSNTLTQPSANPPRTVYSATPPPNPTINTPAPINCPKNIDLVIGGSGAIYNNPCEATAAGESSYAPYIQGNNAGVIGQNDSMPGMSNVFVDENGNELDPSCVLQAEDGSYYLKEECGGISGGNSPVYQAPVKKSWVPGISNTNLLIGAAVVLGIVLIAKK